MGTVDSCLFLTVISDKIFVLYFKMFRGHNNIIHGRIANFLCKNWLSIFFCNVIIFRGRQKQLKHVKGNDIQDALSHQLLYFDLYPTKKRNAPLRTVQLPGRSQGIGQFSLYQCKGMSSTAASHVFCNLASKMS